MTGSSRGIDNFVIKNGEVEGKAEPDRVRRLHFRLRNVKRLLVRLLRILDYRCKCKSASIQITPSTTSFLRRDHPSNKLSLSSGGRCGGRGARREERQTEQKEGRKRKRISTIRLASILQRSRVSFYSEFRRPWTDRVHKSSPIFHDDFAETCISWVIACMSRAEGIVRRERY